MLRWDYGTVYKKIRQSKNLTQEYVCGNVLNRTTLVKFEQNKSIPHYETMHFLLHRIDMTFDEFEYICNHYQKDSCQTLIEKVDLLLADTSSKCLEEMIVDIEKELQKESNLALEDRLDMLKVVLSVRKEGLKSLSSETYLLTEKIWKRLESYDTWYKNDFRLLGTILYYFSKDDLPKLSDLILKRMEKYEHYKEIQGTKLSLLSHLTYLFLEYNAIEYSKRFGKLLVNESQKRKRYDYLAKGYVYLGLSQRDENLISKGLRLLELTDEKGLLAGLRLYVTNYSFKD